MEKYNVKISIIITVYNLENYIDKCLSSVTSQSMSGIEIIVVNDGGSDRSIDIIRKYALVDNRIRVIDKSNGGVVAARRSGLEVATGEYIHYIDGDDYMEPNSYELLYSRAIVSDADMVMFDYNDLRGDYVSAEIADEDMTGLDFIRHSLKYKKHFSLCTHIHRRSLYDNPILYYDDLTIGEDFITTQQLAYYSKKIIFVHHSLYNYVYRESSVTNSTISKKKANDYLRHIDILIDFYKDQEVYSDLEKYLYTLSLDSVGYLFGNKCFYNAKKIAKETLRKIDKYPDLRYIYSVKRIYKLIRLYAICTPLGRAFAQYYIIKGKIK